MAITTTLDPAKYLADNTDVQAAWDTRHAEAAPFGNANDYAAWHWENRGKAEGRSKDSANWLTETKTPEFSRDQLNQIYQQQLGRNVDDAGFNGYQYSKYEDIVKDIQNSNEFKLRSAGRDVRSLNANQVNAPSLPQGTAYAPTNQTAKPGETQSAVSLGAVNPGEVQTVTAQTVNQVAAKDAHTYDAAQVGNNTPQMNAAQGQVRPEDLVTAAQGGPSDAFTQTLADRNTTIQNTDVDPRATVQKQFETLMSGDKAWAQGAMREAEARLAARGMSASSIAGEAITAAVLQAAMPIAQQDAKVFEAMQHTKMDQQQALTVLKAGHLANLDITNLNNRQQAAVVNAQTFLQMDLANLNNTQQASIINTQARVQTLLSDQAAANAAKQFNAASQNQVDQFYDQLNTGIATFNSSQVNAANTFNAGQQNAHSQFITNLNSQREMFSANLNAQIDQSNVNYLRQINTQNTQRDNEANYINAQNLLKVSNTAMANEIQWARDDFAYTWQASQNQLNRDQNLALMVMNRDASMAMLNEKQKGEFGQSLGMFATSIFGSVLSNADKIGKGVEYVSTLF